VPAINPENLKKHSEELVDYFNRPDRFVQKFINYLEIYSDRSRRSGQTGMPKSKIHSYKVNPPVINQVLKDLIPEVKKHPETTLVLCDKLWEQPNLECRQLCAYLLGSVKMNSPEQIMKRLHQYIDKDTEEILIDLLVHQGLLSIRNEFPENVFALIDEWISIEDPFYQKTAIRTLIPIAKEKGSTTLPVIFNQIQPMVRNHSTEIYPDLIELINTLARYFPQETSFYLKRILSLSDSGNSAMLIRNCLNSFPPEIQNGMRENLRKNRMGN
jgi:hypothetical protein